MAQVLVVNEDFTWYKAIASFKNYYEIQVEERVLQHADKIFADFLCLKFKYTFKNRPGATAAADLLLIAKDFSQWTIVEVEMAGKPLGHTKQQISVFTDAVVDIDQITTYCITKEPSLKSKEPELRLLFAKPPKVLILFDSNAEKEITSLSSLFSGADFCTFHIYRTSKHDVELYRIGGAYPYVTTDFAVLNRKKPSFEIYDIDNPSVLDGRTGYVHVLHKLRVVQLFVMATQTGVTIKITHNVFAPEKVLTLAKTLSGELVIDTLS